MNKQLLTYHMAKHQDKYADLAQALGIHKNTFTVKVNKASFTLPEVQAIVKRYNLSNDEVVEIFLR